MHNDVNTGKATDLLKAFVHLLFKSHGLSQRSNECFDVVVAVQDGDDIVAGLLTARGHQAPLHAPFAWENAVQLPGFVLAEHLLNVNEVTRDVLQRRAARGKLSLQGTDLCFDKLANQRFIPVRSR